MTTRGVVDVIARRRTQSHARGALDNPASRAFFPHLVLRAFCGKTTDCGEQSRCDENRPRGPRALSSGLADGRSAAARVSLRLAATSRPF